jgi:hypothetical protein
MEVVILAFGPSQRKSSLRSQRLVKQREIGYLMDSFTPRSKESPCKAQKLIN